jgi:membrane associated rhomboid family serine protease
VRQSEHRTPTRAELAEVARYPLRTIAQERSLVILSMGLGCWIFQDPDGCVLCVEAGNESVARAELAKFERETATQQAARIARATRQERPPVAQLLVFAWFFTGLFLLQGLLPRSLMERGIASSASILGHGEWWRAVTALTLHADLAHFVANLVTGLIFAAFLLPLAGSGVTWSGTLLAGALGNLINAWGYRGRPHESLGASTAVFGTLGILVALESAQMILHEGRPRFWKMIVPVGAGLALLAYLGTGDYEHPEQNTTDYMAHLWGFGAGLFIGAIAGFLRLEEKMPHALRRLLCLLPPAVIALAWWLAART